MFSLAIVGVALAVVGWISWQMGGWRGFQREVLIKGAVNGVEIQALRQRPDGVSEAEIKATFDHVRNAISQERIDLDRLYQALHDYQYAFKGSRKRPSDGEMRSFLQALQASIPATSPPPEFRP